MSTANAWRVRHEGSPQSIDELTVQDVAQGLQERHWEPTDEVRGPGDTDWVAIEGHPQFEEVAADLEPPPEHEHDDESHVDMNALIDVCLVLLVFFILTTSYAALTKQLDAPDLAPDGIEKKPAITKQQIDRSMVLVTVKMENGSPVYRVEGTPVPRELLTAECTRYVSKTNKTILLLDYDADVPHGAVMKVHDSAKGAGMTKVLWVRGKQK